MTNQAANQAKNVTSISGPKQTKRYTEELDGLNLEYELRSATIWKLFGFPEAKVKEIPALSRKVPVRVYFSPGTNDVFHHPLVPQFNPTHEFDVLEVALCIEYFLKGRGFPPYFYGLHGTGKTSFFDQFHARLGLPKVQIILGEDSEVIDLGGQMLPTEAGGMKFHEGLLVQSMRNGWTLMFDEYDLLPTRQQKMLNDVLENKRFTIEITGQTVVAHKNWRVCACGNTNNTGTGNGLSVSGGGLDASVNERFFFYEKKYLSKESEKRILTDVAIPYLEKYPDVLGMENEAARAARIKELVNLVCGKEDEKGTPMPCLIDQMLLVCERIRTAHINSRKSMSANGVCLESVMSTRALKEWCKKTLELMSFYAGSTNPEIQKNIFKEALRFAFINGIADEEQAIVEQIFDDSIGCN